MSQPSLTAKGLAKALKIDYRASDLGDTAEEFEARLTYIAAQALLRENVTPAQIEAGARYLLIGAQIRQLIRQAEELKGASGSSVRQDLASKLQALRTEQARQEHLSGLGASVTLGRSRSVSVEVQNGF